MFYTKLLKQIVTDRISKFSSIPTMTNNIESSKANAAIQAVDDNIFSDCVLGIGSGTTMIYVLDRLKKKCKEMSLQVRCVPTSFQSKQLIHEFGLPITDLELEPQLDVTIDGADEMDRNFVAIKGGGACLAQEKVIANASSKFIVVADYRKNSTALGDNWKKGIPIEVLPMAFNAVRHQLSKRFSAKLDDFELRIAERKAGPIITDNGNFVIDWKFDPNKTSEFTSSDWNDLSNKIRLIPGVVETGIFAGMIDEAYFGLADGGVMRKVAQR